MGVVQKKLILGEPIAIICIDTCAVMKKSDKNDPTAVIIPFPKTMRPRHITEEDTDNYESWGEDFFEFEEWEKDYELIEKKDYKGLLKIRKERIDRYPDNEYAQYYLAEAYILNKAYIKALNYLSDIHNDQPDRVDIQYLIIDTLYAIGKTENDFHWLEKPKVVHLSDAFIESCYEYLKRKRKPRSIDEVYSTFIYDGYIHFTREDLLQRLIKDGRFIVEDPDDPFFAMVCVNRKKKQDKSVDPKNWP